MEVGQYPARFEIMKMRLLFMKYILNNDSNSLIYKFFELQIAQHVKGDWASSCFKDLENLNIELTLENIKEMPKTTFKRLVKEKINKHSSA